MVAREHLQALVFTLQAEGQMEETQRSEPLRQSVVDGVAHHITLKGLVSILAIQADPEEGQVDIIMMLQPLEHMDPDLVQQVRVIEEDYRERHIILEVEEALEGQVLMETIRLMVDPEYITTFWVLDTIGVEVEVEVDILSREAMEELVEVEVEEQGLHMEVQVSIQDQEEAEVIQYPKPIWRGVMVGQIREVVGVEVLIIITVTPVEMEDPVSLSSVYLRMRQIPQQRSKDLLPKK